MAEHTDTTTTPRSGHPIEALLCSVLDDLKGLADVPTWSMDAETTTRVVALAARVAAGVAEVEARAIGQAGVLGLPAEGQYRDTARWVQRTTGVTRRTARGKVRLAEALGDLEPTRAATARGEIHAEQAQAIADQVALLDAELVSAHDQARAEAFLLNEATGGCDADALVGLGQAIWERLDPTGFEKREAKALEAQEARARAKTKLSMANAGDGLTHGRFTIPTAIADAFRKQLHALAAPKHVRAAQGAGAYDWKTPSAERMGHAFIEWIGGYDPTQLPKIGGLSATVVVIGDYEILQGKIKAATLETGTRISHTEYLRMACDAGIIPAWMNANGEVLALGRTCRFHTPAQRLAAIIEQRHCQHHSGCTVPGYLCHAHHQIPWAQGGGTDLRTTQLLCPYHHARAHDPSTDPMRT
ncbi:HNH endonuclease signature motif containing protein [Nocardioides rubriscoriae]|uniref:HNH endonuclease signature motif containing protein n=1 Tax=Nocardioides rubriscoriae TaxID=642762 RepID=UPI0011DFD772|nr:HNH endonuclease signature motif containing protein [Nocardioides rubriscoriae]